MTGLEERDVASVVAVSGGDVPDGAVEVLGVVPVHEGGDPRTRMLEGRERLLYAGRDRLKALAEQWLSSGLRRLAAERVTRLLSPLEAHHVVARAKESFEERGLSKADALSPELGGVDQATLLRIVHSGELHSFSDTSRLRPRALRLVFRYDVSPLFARLDDPMKSLAVADPEADRLQLVTASRTYRIVVRLGLKSGAAHETQQYDLVLDKRGLLRLEPHA